MFVRLIKIKESSNPLHPNNIEEGRVEIGFMNDEPEIGKPFLITNGRRWFRTSTVQKIIDDNTFETLNSVYKIEKDENKNEISG